MLGLSLFHAVGTLIEVNHHCRDGRVPIAAPTSPIDTHVRIPQGALSCELSALIGHQRRPHAAQHAESANFAKILARSSMAAVVAAKAAEAQVHHLPLTPACDHIRASIQEGRAWAMRA